MKASPGHREVIAEWARIGKTPGSADDYGILAASRGNLDVRVLSEFATSYVAGIPDLRLDPDSPPAPPWVTFGTHASAGRRFITVDIQLPWEGLRDQTGRPTWSRNFFVLPYDTVAECGLSYQTLYAAVREVELPPADGLPLGLRLEPQPVDDLIPAIEHFGFERLAAIAAALLDSPVAVGGAEGLRLGGRLRLLDAVAALLPPAFRAELSASSAVSGLNVPRMRLVLTNVTLDNRLRAHLTEGPSPDLSPGACDYCGQLLREAESRGLAALVGHLWTQSGQPFPAPVVAALTPLRGIGASAGESGFLKRAGEPDSIDRLFALEYFARPPEVLAREWEHLAKASRGTFLRLVLVADVEETRAALGRTWPIVVRDLIALVNDDLDRGGTELAAHGLAAAAAIDPPKAADQFLEYILVSGLRKDVPEGWPERIRPRVDLLRGFRAPPAAAAFPETRTRLRYGRENGWQARLVAALLTDELADRARACGWAMWITGPAPGTGGQPRPNWVTALNFVVTGQGEPGVAATAMSEVIRSDPHWAVLLFRFAESFDRLTDTLAVLRTADCLPEAAAALAEEWLADADQAAEARGRPGSAARHAWSRFRSGRLPFRLPGPRTADDDDQQERRDGIPRS